MAAVSGSFQGESVNTLFTPYLGGGGRLASQTLPPVKARWGRDGGGGKIDESAFSLPLNRPQMVETRSDPPQGTGLRILRRTG